MKGDGDKMKVLLWSVCSPWTMNFVENFLVKHNYEVWILSIGNNRDCKEYADFYKRKGLHLIELPPLALKMYEGKIGFFKAIYGRFLKLKAVIKAGPFDIINMQFVYYADLPDAIFLKYFMRAKLILSYWGSDLFRVDRDELVLQGRYVRHADFITFDNLDLEKEFKKTYNWGKKIPSKAALLGLPVLDIINKSCGDKAKDDIRRKWGIAKDKIVIAIGYNGIPQQQHKRILNVIRRLDKQYKEKIILLLQMSYGGSREYKRSVIKAVKRTEYEYIDIQHFLSNSEVAELRIMTDIFINAQTTDAFSGSVCEYLFADTIIINAKWLLYKEFEKYDFQYLEFESFDDIPLLIQKVVEQEIDTFKNKELVWKLRSWEHCDSKWEKIYRRMCE